MTVRVNTLKGVEAGRYYTDRLPSYYLDGEEPPGRWWGQAAGRLGLHGQVDPESFLGVMAGHDPATGKDLGRRHGEGSVRGYDATFSAPKSVSILFAVGDDQVRDHAVISNRVPAPDGRWLALDARTMMVDQRTLSALYHACLRAELTRRIGVVWEIPEHGISEIAGIPEVVLAEFSQRSIDIERRLSVKLERFRSDLDREPSVRERWWLEREAVSDSRPAKPHGVTLAQLHQEWTERTLGLGYVPQQLLRRVVGRVRRLDGIDHHMTTALADTALRALGEGQSSWRHAEILRELAGAVPTTTAIGSAELTGVLDGLADDIAESRCVDISRPVPSGVPLRRDGRPITEPAVDRTLTTRSILDEEEEMIARAQLRKQSVATRRRPRTIRFTQDLTRGQEEAVAAVAGDGGLELIVGPAGAGKTTMLAKAKLNLAVQGRQAFGVAPTAAAAEVLATETSVPADTLDKLLVEHAHPSRPPLPGYDLGAGTTVIVDEEATASTPKLAQLFRLADEHDWLLVLVGDPRQFSAVGRSGMFAHLVDLHGAVELDRVHRFRHSWERQASLGLRTGDPAALTEYHKRGRIHGGTLHQMETDIINAWQEARSQDDTVALMANNTDTVAHLNQLAQQTRVTAGELDPAGPSLRVGETKMLVGDEVVTRRNNRTLRTDQGLMVKNRDHWTITGIHRDRSVTITGRTGTIRLPAEYVTENLELGYAQTSHATQGRTVDTALLLIDSPTDSRGVYTPMTRGREANHAYVVTEDNHTGLDVLTQALAREWIDQPAVARRLELNPDRQRKLEQLLPGEADEIDELMRRARRRIAERQERKRRIERTLDRGV